MYIQKEFLSPIPYPTSPFLTIFFLYKIIFKNISKIKPYVIYCTYFSTLSGKFWHMCIHLWRNYKVKKTNVAITPKHFPLCHLSLPFPRNPTFPSWSVLSWRLRAASADVLLLSPVTCLANPACLDDPRSPVPAFPLVDTVRSWLGYPSPMLMSGSSLQAQRRGITGLPEVFSYTKK